MQNSFSRRERRSDFQKDSSTRSRCGGQGTGAIWPREPGPRRDRLTAFRNFWQVEKKLDNLCSPMWLTWNQRGKQGEAALAQQKNVGVGAAFAFLF